MRGNGKNKLNIVVNYNVGENLFFSRWVYFPYKNCIYMSEQQDAICLLCDMFFFFHLRCTVHMYRIYIVYFNIHNILLYLFIWKIKLNFYFNKNSLLEIECKYVKIIILAIYTICTDIFRCYILKYVICLLIRCQGEMLFWFFFLLNGWLFNVKFIWFHYGFIIYRLE